MFMDYHFLFEIAVILLSTKVLGILTKRFALPGCGITGARKRETARAVPRRALKTQDTGSPAENFSAARRNSPSSRRSSRPTISSGSSLISSESQPIIMPAMAYM